MYPPTTLSALSFPFPRSFARPLSALLCLLCGLLPSPLVWAQTGTGAPAAVQSEAEARVLKMGEPVERELAGGQQHAYQITLSAGQYLNAVVEQRGIDVVVVLFAPDGKKLLEVDSPNGEQGPEPLAWIAETAGVYRLEVRSLEKDAKAGRYEARLIELRPATASDRARIEKAQALSEIALLDNELNKLRDAGQYDKALPLAKRLLEISEKALGAEHPDTATSLNSLAVIYKSKGDYAKAEPLYQRALAIREKVLGAEHPDTANSLSNLAGLYYSKGDYAKAEPLFLRALAIREKALGAEHPSTANSLNNLAGLYYSKGDYAKAEPLFLRALAMHEKARGAEHPSTAASLNNLALLYKSKGDYAKAEPLYLRALAILEKVLGAAHPNTGNSLSNLAGLYSGKGDYAKAEPLYLRALAIHEKALGAEHPNTATSFNNLAANYESEGNLIRAVSMRARASAIEEQNIRLNTGTGSERQKQVYLATLTASSARAISLHVGSAPNNAEARDLALTVILQRKGRALDAMSDSLATLRRRAKPEDQALLDQLQETNAQLARLVLNGPQRITPAEHQARIKSLEEQKEKLEAGVSARSAEFRAQAASVTIAAVQSAIPINAALVEFFSYPLFNPKAQKFGERHYIAYALHRQGEAQWVELGEAKAIDEAVAKLRQALRDKRRKDVKQLARVVDEKVMQPVRVLLGQTRRVFISPDGALNLIPFAALVDERNRYLIQRYSFSYLTSGRDLLRLQVKQPSKQTALLVANPDFGEEAKAGSAQQRLLMYRPGTKAATGEGAVLAGYYFPPLQGTAGEARALKAMMPGATVLVQAQATEATLKQVSSPRILHIATHGFFLENQQPSSGPSPSEDRLLRPMSGEEPVVVGQIENPLLRSGLALAGANRQTSGEGDDGILTAQEAAGLDLWGTKLVVLSACDTGVGEVKNGEGVYGLRRALVLAGSETQVMSLWPVSDKATRDLMIEYYRRLLRGEGRSAALRQVQLRMLASPSRGEAGASRLLVTKGRADTTSKETKRPRDYSHPYYWASFIQSGEWANLEGKR